MDCSVELRPLLKLCKVQALLWDLAGGHVASEYELFTSAAHLLVHDKNVREGDIDRENGRVRCGMCYTVVRRQGTPSSTALLATRVAVTHANEEDGSPVGGVDATRLHRSFIKERLQPRMTSRIALASGKQLLLLLWLMETVVQHFSAREVQRKEVRVDLKVGSKLRYLVTHDSDAIVTSWKDQLSWQVPTRTRSNVYYTLYYFRACCSPVGATFERFHVASRRHLNNEGESYDHGDPPEKSKRHTVGHEPDAEQEPGRKTTPSAQRPVPSRKPEAPRGRVKRRAGHALLTTGGKASSVDDVQPASAVKHPTAQPSSMVREKQTSDNGQRWSEDRYSSHREKSSANKYPSNRDMPGSHPSERQALLEEPEAVAMPLTHRRLLVHQLQDQEGQATETELLSSAAEKEKYSEQMLEMEAYSFLQFAEKQFKKDLELLERAACVAHHVLLMPSLHHSRKQQNAGARYRMETEAVTQSVSSTTFKHSVRIVHDTHQGHLA
ncbi:hypothetical protein HPB49_011050 [Dermacentor silvarum]|uniref:Uncharacterized protein n=1 Tax=Dermacentor silvarum TaxID=543639 RepID=A0ACB8DJ40_DERSI|nr:hypothetical protein HPB49_011050 [Dermacentor silvarum]